MKRLQQSTPTALAPSTTFWDETDEPWFSSAPPSARHALFMPLHYEKNYAYPLLIWLHGDGACESQLKGIMPLVSLRNYVAIAPRGTCRSESGSGEGFTWREHSDDIVEALHRVRDCRHIAAEKCHTHSDRVFVAGYGSGGTMALRLAMLAPEHFAGALSIGGGFPQGHAPLANIHRARQVPLFVAYGRDGSQYPTSQVCDDLRLAHAAGITISLRQYPCGDDLTTQMLSDVDCWIMEQVTGSPSEPQYEPMPEPGEWN